MFETLLTHRRADPRRALPGEADVPRAGREELGRRSVGADGLAGTDLEDCLAAAGACYQPDHGAFHAVLVMRPGDTRDALREALWGAGMLVTEFSSVREAEGVLVGQVVHVVLVDLGLGVDVAAAAVRSLRASGRMGTRVVALGSPAAPVRAELEHAGVTRCSLHQSRPAEFARRLARALGYPLATWHP